MNLNNLAKLCEDSNIRLYTEKNNIRSKNMLLKECDKKKIQEIKNNTINLSNLAKLGNISSKKVKEINELHGGNIEKIDKLVEYIKIFPLKKQQRRTYSDDDFIEIYSNY